MTTSDGAQAAAGAKGTIARLRSRLRNRPDSEHEMTINRLAILSLVLGYLIVASAAGNPSAIDMFEKAGALFEAHYLIALALFVHICAFPGVSRARRLIALTADIAAISYGMHVGNDATSLAYPLYLWTVFGNGFRFGVSYLYIATLLATAGFAAVMATTPVWHDNLTLSAGLLVGLVVLPLYVGVLIRKISEAKLQAEAASRAKTLFLASVSHELRTPLNAIIGLGDLMGEDPGLTRDQRDMSRTITSAGRSLLGLINGLLDLSRMEVGQMPVESKRFDLHGLLREVHSMVAVQATRKGLRVGLFIAAPTPRWVVGDPERLREILTNLAGNAIKFTEQGEVSLLVRAEADGRLRFEVVDTGIGIAPHAHARIFESFTQADETISNRFGGTGLGLSIVKRLVEMQHGRLGLDSAPGRGSTFWFELPLEAQEGGSVPEPERVPLVVLTRDRALTGWLSDLGHPVQHATAIDAAAALAAQTRDGLVVIDEAMPGWQAVAAALSEAFPAGVPPLLLMRNQTDPLDPKVLSLFSTALDRNAGPAAWAMACRVALPERDDVVAAPVATGEDGLSVLVAEDNLVNQKVIRKVLIAEGHRVHVVNNGAEALQALQQGEFDIALIDINMPVMSGLEAARLYAFAVGSGRDGVPLVALTADATEATARDCAAAGMADCITKPVDRTRLRAILARHGRRRMAEASLAPADEHVPAAVAVLNDTAVAMLVDLGGSDFASELLGDFLVGADRAIADLRSAAADHDMTAFRAAAHALKSAAGNVGADRIAWLCTRWGDEPARTLAEHASDNVLLLTHELHAVQSAVQVLRNGMLRSLSAA